MSPLAASRIYAAEQKVICGGKRHLIELDMETGFYKDVSLSISLVSNWVIARDTFQVKTEKESIQDV